MLVGPQKQEAWRRNPIEYQHRFVVVRGTVHGERGALQEPLNVVANRNVVFYDNHGSKHPSGSVRLVPDR
jgi:hypothetical protein